MAKVLVTGGAGFIGAHLVDRLIAASYQVRVLDNMKRGSPAKIERHLAQRSAELLEGDVRDRETVLAALHDVTTVYHLAAQSNVMGALDDPEYSFSTNAFGTFNVLRCASEAGIQRVVFTSSREVYGNPQSLPVREEAPLSPKNPYGASKVAGEAYCRSFAACHPLKVEVVRLANVYGAGDSDRVIPLWLQAASKGNELRVYGGEQVIDFVWIGTVIDALRFAGEKGLPGPVNIASGVGTSILDLGARILEVVKGPSEFVRAPARSVEVARFVADTAKMRELGLVPDQDPLAHLAELVPHYSSSSRER